MKGVHSVKVKSVKVWEWVRTHHLTLRTYCYYRYSNNIELWMVDRNEDLGSQCRNGAFFNAQLERLTLCNAVYVTGLHTLGSRAGVKLRRKME